MSRVPVPDQEVVALKALIVGLCVLLVMTPATAAANGQQTSARAKQHTSKSSKASSLTLGQKLALKVKAARKYRGAIRFFVGGLTKKFANCRAASAFTCGCFALLVINTE